MLAMQKPDVSQLTTLVGPVAEQMQAATALTEGRRSSAFNHQRTVAEALHALTWLVYTGPGCGEPPGLLDLVFSRAAIVGCLQRPCDHCGCALGAGLYPDLPLANCLPPCQPVNLGLLWSWMHRCGLSAGAGRSEAHWLLLSSRSAVASVGCVVSTWRRTCMHKCTCMHHCCSLCTGLAVVSNLLLSWPQLWLAAAAAILAGQGLLLHHVKAPGQATKQHTCCWPSLTHYFCNAGISLPAQQVEESWGSAQFWANKVCCSCNPLLTYTCQPMLCTSLSTA